MTDRPIIFSAVMIRALLAGTKTQTRRIAKFVREGEPDGMRWHVCNSGGGTMTNDDAVVRQVGPDYAPYAPGDRLWAREAGALVGKQPVYRAEHAEASGRGPRVDERWRSPIHMPRWASRITLHVEDVRVQRVQEIDEEDARAEGADPPPCGGCGEATPTERCIGCLHPFYTNGFRVLWNRIHGPGAWDRNDWVVAIRFRAIHANIDAPEAANG